MDEQTLLDRVKQASDIRKEAQRIYLEELTRAHEAGIGYRKLGEVLGIHPASVFRYLKRHSVQHGPDSSSDSGPG